MKRFRFTLQAVLALRQREERQALEEYGRAVQAERQALEELAAVEKEITANWSFIAAQSKNGTSAQWLAQGQAYTMVLDEKKKKQDAAVASARKASATAHQRLLKARQRREALDKLHTRQRERYDFEERRAEQKWLDDLSTRCKPAINMTPATTTTP